MNLNEEVKVEDYYDLQPSLGRWADWRMKFHQKRMERIQAKAEMKLQDDQMEENGIVTKSQLKRNMLKNVITGACIALSILCSIYVAPISLFFSGVFASQAVLNGVILVAGIINTVRDYKEYKKNNPTAKKRQETKKESKEKGKKLGLGKRIRNLFTKSKKKSNEENIDFNLNIDEPISEPIQNKVEEEVVKPTQQEEPTLNVIPNINLSKEFKKAKIKEANVTYIPGIGIYIYPVEKGNKDQQKFFEAGYAAVYEETPMSIETETHKVYVLNKFSK